MFLFGDKHKQNPSALKQDKQDGVAKFERESEDIFVNYGRQTEDQQLRKNSISSCHVFIQIFIDVKVEPEEL